MTNRNRFKEIMLKKFFNVVVSLFATGSVAAQQSEPLKVLFIGNSYTHMNNMPKMFDKIAKNAGMNVLVEKSALSGASFQIHSERKDMYEAINKRQWDYVILQGYSRELTFEPNHIDSASIPYLNKITDSIYKNNACTNVLFYMTWGYDDGFKEREEVDSYEKMATKIEAGYRYLAGTYDVPVVPAGMVWKRIKTETSIDLYADDRAHPSKRGSFLVASTFFESIFGIRPNEEIGIIDEDEARKIREAVNEELIEKRALYNLDRYQVNLETTILDTVDEEQLKVEYSINYPKAKSVSWSFDKEEVSRSFTGVHYYRKYGKHTVKADVMTECGQVRSYTRNIFFLNPRKRRRNERKTNKEESN